MTFWVVFFSSGFSEILGETEWNSHAAWLHSSNGVFWGYTVLICITLDRFIPEKHFKHKRTGSRQIWLSWTSKTSDTPLPWETYIKYMICMCNYTKSSCIYIYINIIYRHMIFSVIWHYFGFMSCQHRQRCVCVQISRWHVECSKSLCMLCTNSFGTQPLDDTSKVSSHNVSSNVPHLPFAKFLFPGFFTWPCPVINERHIPAWQSAMSIHVQAIEQSLTGGQQLPKVTHGEL